MPKFKVNAELWSRDMIIGVLGEVPQHIVAVDANFPLEKLPSNKDYLVLRANEEA